MPVVEIDKFCPAESCWLLSKVTPLVAEIVRLPPVTIAGCVPVVFMQKLVLVLVPVPLIPLVVALMPVALIVADVPALSMVAPNKLTEPPVIAVVV